MGQKQTYFTFEDTLSQIGLGYTFLFVLALCSPLAFNGSRLASSSAATGRPSHCIRLPGSSFDFSSVGVRPDWLHHPTGFAAHWDKNSNLAWAFDTWFLNLFPRTKPFSSNGGGYATLSFIPTLGTMILGLLAGGILRAHLAGLGQAALALRSRCRRATRRLGAGRARHLSRGQADLDAELGPLQRRFLLPVPRRVLRAARPAAACGSGPSRCVSSA